MKASTVILASASEANEIGWNDVVGDSPTAQHGALRTFESTNALGTRPVYFALDGAQSPTAVAIGYVAAEQSQFQQLISPLLGRAHVLAPALVRMLGPTLILSLRPNYGAPVLVNARADRTVRHSLLHELCGAIETYADEQGLTLAVVGVKSWDRDLGDVLRKRNFQGTQGYPTAELEVCWESWEGYLRHFRSKRRRTIRREVNAFSAAGCRIRAATGSETLSHDLYGMYQEHYQRKNERPAPCNERLLADFANKLPHNSRIYVAEKNNQLLGFMAILWKGRTGGAAYIGIARQARAQNQFVYFNFLYQIARDAPKLGIKKVLFGATVYDGKRLRGCSITPTSLFLRPARGLTRLASGTALAMHRRWYERKFRQLVSAPCSGVVADVGAARQ